MRRVSARPSRAVGVLLATFVSWQAAGFTAAALSAPAGRHFCCHHEGALKCACPVCSHARELASPNPSIRSCGGTSDARAIAVAQTPSLPAVWLALSPRPGPFLMKGIPAPLLSSAFPEVPTPPPL